MYAGSSFMGRGFSVGTRYRRLVGFCLIGVFSTVIDIGLLFILTAYFGMWYIAAAAGSYCCGTIVSYSLNKYLTFQDDSKNIVVQFSSFATISSGCLLLTIGIIWFAVEHLHFGYLPAKLSAVTGVFLLNYFGQSRVTFREGGGQSGAVWRDETITS